MAEEVTVQSPEPTTATPTISAFDAAASTLLGQDGSSRAVTPPREQSAPSASNAPSQKTPTSQPEPGQAARAEPGPGQGDGTGATPKAGAQEPASKSGQASASVDIKPEDILAHIGLKETPDQELARLKRDYGASRTEVLRLKKVAEGLPRILEAQGLTPVFDEQGEVVGLAPGEKHPASAKDAAIRFDQLDEREQALAETKPQAFIDLIADRLKKTLVRPAPTVEKAIQPVSAEREQAIVAHLAELTYDDGETRKHPNIKDNLPIIRQMVSAPSNAALKDFLNAMPDLALSLLDARVEQARSFLTQMARRATETQTKKENEAGKSFIPAPAAGGSPGISTGPATPDSMGRAWAKEIASAERY